MIIKPTVGRKVWYRPSAADMAGNHGMKCVNGQPLDATIVAVWGDRMVNLLVLDSYGRSFSLTSVTLLQEGDAPQKDAEDNIVSAYAEWMPFQVGQAKAAQPEADAAPAA